LSFRFKTSRRAERQIRAAADWWRKNREKAPDLFAEELESAFVLIEALPNAGEPVRHPRIPGLRRVLLGRVQYFLYYSVSPEAQVVDVLALWHTRRRKGPLL
jgi:plasmid stabilization system protein ParE